ncbi:hypothetical protein JG687_00013030 [Phytophthora cactorum]|uniref:Homeodomain-like n=1 Tax=Phytophthora cactorum TaxID=29920 RepID=A0A8T1U0E8_9STRA|nr:hypothetical protein JG687_00013030 [Phytophthora cactorum]
MQEAVTKQHAHPNTVLHCLYGFDNLGYSRKELARVYHESETTIGNWIRVYEATGTFERARKASDKKFSSDHRAWLCDFYGKHPLAYLDEVQEAFVQAHHITISKSSIWRIIRDYGLTWKEIVPQQELEIVELRLVLEGILPEQIPKNVELKLVLEKLLLEQDLASIWKLEVCTIEAGVPSKKVVRQSVLAFDHVQDMVIHEPNVEILACDAHCE